MTKEDRMEVQKILLVSNEIDVFLRMEGIFALRDNIDLLLARTEEQTLSMAKTEQPGLILVDRDLPQGGGEAFQRRIRAILPSSDVPIIPIVSTEDIESMKTGGSLGEGECIRKPIDPRQFLRTISRYLGGDRRTVPRVPARLRINYGIEGREVLADYSVNLSSGGVFIETNEVLPADTPLFLKFSLPESGLTVRCTGRVAWVNHPEEILSPQLPPGMGVQFLDLGLQQMHGLREFLNRETLQPSW